MPKMSEIEAARERLKKGNEHPMPVEEALARFWDLLIKLREKDGVKPLSLHEGLWIRKVDEHWTIKGNGHKEEIDHVPPFSIYVEFNGWPAGFIDPGGSSFAAGTLANFDTFNAALEAALHDDDTAPL